MVPEEATTIGSSAPLPFAVTLDASDSGVSRAAVSVSVTAPDPLVAPEIPDRYQLLGPLGEGGFGRVDAVFDRQLLREVARKSLRPGGDGAGEREARFINEARITGKLEHPGIVPVHEIGRQDDGTLYYVMGLVKGHSLEEALLEKTFEERLRYLPAFVDACNAVAYAHSRGVIHRDLKPDNIRVAPVGRDSLNVQVLDFGVARLLDPSASMSGAVAIPLTRAGALLGTPGYMSPQQISGDPVDHRADLYALGVILWEALSGERLWKAREIEEIFVRQIREQPPHLVDDHLGIQCPAPLADLVDQLLARDPDARPVSAAEVHTILARIVGVKPAVERVEQARSSLTGVTLARGVARGLRDPTTRKAALLIGVPALLALGLALSRCG
ncbi:MAG: serine/threonine protein kinase [Myxococcales bacterium]|nr:serine/threonine protein kinase [Myxococcales bacterium]